MTGSTAAQPSGNEGCDTRERRSVRLVVVRGTFSVLRLYYDSLVVADQNVQRIPVRLQVNGQALCGYAGDAEGQVYLTSVRYQEAGSAGFCPSARSGMKFGAALADVVEDVE